MADVPRERRDWTGQDRMGRAGPSTTTPSPSPGYCWCCPGAKGWVLPAAKIAAEISTSSHLLSSSPISRKEGFFSRTLFSLSPRASSLDVPSCGENRGTQWCVWLHLGASQGGKTFHKMDVSKGKDECWHMRDRPHEVLQPQHGAKISPLPTGAGLVEGIIGRCF